ncbi:MAG: DinB family protein [Chloroflexota bacterium]
MAPVREAEVFHRYIIGSITHLLDCLDGLTPEQINWKPPAPETNSLYALVVHTMANTEENVLGVVCGLPIDRNHDQEFSAAGPSVSSLRARFLELADEMRRELAKLESDAMDSERPHPRRGSITIREVLLVAARHAAEHYGQALLTRDLALAQAMPSME